MDVLNSNIHDFTGPVKYLSIVFLLTVSKNCGLTLVKECDDANAFKVVVRKTEKSWMEIELTHGKQVLSFHKDRKNGETIDIELAYYPYEVVLFVAHPVSYLFQQFHCQWGEQDFQRIHNEF